MKIIVLVLFVCAFFLIMRKKMGEETKSHPKAVKAKEICPTISVKIDIYVIGQATPDILRLVKELKS